MRSRFAGIQGLQQRRQIGQISSQLDRQQQDVQAFREGVEQYSQEVNQASQQVEEAERERQGYERALRLIKGEYRVPPSFVEDPYVKKYYEPLYEGYKDQQELNRDYKANLNKAVEQYNEGVPLEQAFKNFNVQNLIKRGYLKFDQTNNAGATQLASQNFNSNINQQPIQGLMSMAPKINDRTYRTQVTNSVNGRSLLTGDVVLASAGQSQSINMPIMSLRDDINTSQSRVLGGVNRQSNILVSSRQPTGDFSSSVINRIGQDRNLNVPTGDGQTQNQIRPEINPSTGLPYGVGFVSATPSVRQQFKTSIKEQGVLTGTLNFLGNKAVGQVDKFSSFQAKRGGDQPYNIPTGAIELVRGAPTFAAYSTPAGAYLAVVGGAEKVILAPTITGKAIGVAEAGLGGFGAFKGIQAARITSSVKNSPIRVIGDVNGDTGKFLSQTNVAGRDIRTASVVKFRRDDAGNIIGSSIRQFERRQSPSFVELTRTRSNALNEPISGNPFISRDIRTNVGTITTRRPFVSDSLGGVTPFRSQSRVFDTSRIRFRRDPNLLGNAGRTRRQVLESNIIGGGILPSDRSIKQFAGVSRRVTGQGFEKIFSGNRLSVINPSDEIFGFLGGSPRLRVARRGGLSLTIKPQVRGVVRVQGSRVGTSDNIFTRLDDTSSGVKQITTKDQESIFGSIPLQAIERQTRQKALRSVQKFVKPLRQQSTRLVTASKTVAIGSALGLTQLPKSSASSNVLTGFVTASSGKSNVPVNRPTQRFDLLNNSQARLGKFNIDLFGNQQRSRTAQNQGLASLSAQGNTLRFRGVSRSQLQKLSRSRAVQQSTRTQSQSRARRTFGAPFVPKTVFSSSKGKIVKAGQNLYIVYVRRQGQDISIGQSSTLEEAKQLLTSNLRSTLGASGFVFDVGGRGRADVSDLFGSEFTSSRRDSNRVVQRRERRLSSRSEVGEIFGFRNARPSGSSRRSSRRTSRTKQINWFS